MPEKISQYLDAIEATKTLRERVDRIHEMAKLINPEEIDEIFITNLPGDNGFNEYLNIWFFAENYITEGKNFMLSEDVDLLCITDNVGYVQIRADDFDFISSTSQSKLFINFSIQNVPGLAGEFISSGANCEYLLDIYKRRFLTNLTKPNRRQ